jgi:putative DNA primase/helicase
MSPNDEPDPQRAALLERLERYESTNGHAAGAMAPELDASDLTEDALALEFSRRHRDELRYVHEWGQWLRWDGVRWASERTLAVYDLARAIVREAGDRIGATKRTRIESGATVAAIVTLARADRVHARVTEDFDADPWLLNTPAGTVDLHTGELRAHRREDGLTKVTPISPSAEAAPLWKACLRTWTQGDDELEAFLQRLAGYCLTGSVKEEVLPIVYGCGGNGKTKCIETFRGCLGVGYVTGVAMETLIITAGEQHPTDLADLRGKRLAIATETEQGRPFAEARVKALTGGDRIRARYMRHDFFEFVPTHKLLIVGNHRPVLRNVDDAIRRRLLLIPFDAVIPPESRDTDLAAKLVAEYPAILQWMIDGCLEWQAKGLRPPKRVQGATDDYFESGDAVARWVDERCITGPNETMSKAAAFASWRTWAEAAGEFVGSERRLNERLARFPRVDEARLGKDRVRTWIGIGLQPAGT